ncbi:retrotransposon protein, putative, ty1-copia subclass [Tanacetum coccineum]|uniref:Retrotransposon protein, putative, ty1-copia subclass n=1 Tax=Tanacetum coccineum TaxID=301880 RepID=A0ABQ4YMX0_9ASTR
MEISCYTDCSLVEIISRLDSTEEVIRTCILSKRWKHLWTQVPILNLTLKPYSVDEDRRIPEFISYVKKVVNQRGQSRLNKFVLTMPYDSSNESIVSKLIRYAVTCNVQDLYLFLVDPYDVNPEFVLDQNFFVNSSFNHLRLDGCSFNNATGVISWSNLKRLCITYGKLDEDLVKNILSGSPLLENLELVYCFGFGRINITSPSVKKLFVTGYRERGYIVEIYAPHILSLTIKEDLMSSKVVLLNVSSLVEARLDYSMGVLSSKAKKEEMLKGHILSLRHVKKLKIGHYCLKHVSGVDYGKTCSQHVLMIAKNGHVRRLRGDGFAQNLDETCVYQKASGSNVTFLILYVDDIIIMGNHTPSLQSVKNYLGKCFSMKDLGEATFILGIKIYRDRSKRLIGIGQNTYMDKILKRYKMDNSKRGHIPMQERLDLNKSQGSQTPKEVNHIKNIPYASAVGSIMYAIAVKTILKYLRNTKDMFLVFGGNPSTELRVECYCNVGFETDRDDTKSQTGYIFILNGGAVD